MPPPRPASSRVADLRFRSFLRASFLKSNETLSSLSGNHGSRARLRFQPEGSTKILSHDAGIFHDIDFWLFGTASEQPAWGAVHTGCDSSLLVRNFSQFWSNYTNVHYKLYFSLLTVFVDNPIA